MRIVVVLILVVLMIKSCASIKNAKLKTLTNVKLIIDKEGEEYKIFENSCELLDISFKAKVETQMRLIFDFNAFSHDCHYKDELPKNISQISLNKLSYSHFILESSDGEFRFYDDFRPNIKRPNLDDCYLNSPKEVVLGKDEVVRLMTASVCKEDLRFNSFTDKIRIYYFFQPNEKQRNLGYKSFIVQSNWLQLN